MSCICVRGFDSKLCFFDFSIGFWSCSNSLHFVLSVGAVNFINMADVPPILFANLRVLYKIKFEDTTGLVISRK